MRNYAFFVAIGRCADIHQRAFMCVINAQWRKSLFFLGTGLDRVTSHLLGNIYCLSRPMLDPWLAMLDLCVHFYQATFDPSCLDMEKNVDLFHFSPELG